jgi:hypothetical protein
LREWAKGLLTLEELKYIFLNKHHGGKTVWQEAVQSGNLEVLATLWGWAKELVTQEKIKTCY